MRACILATLLVLAGGTASAQDTRLPVEPTFPPICKSLAAPLSIDREGPVVAGDTAAAEDAESARQTRDLQRALEHCGKGRAVELRLGPGNRTAFLIEPVRIPAGASLIVQAGVTVYASRNPEKYQAPGTDVVCGQVGKGYPVTGGCQALITMTGSGSGIYGYGVLDGQGHREMTGGPRKGDAWWDLLVVKKVGCTDGSDTDSGVGADKDNGCQQSAPVMIYANGTPDGSTLRDLALYKITLRNPQFHTSSLGGNGVTIWGVKVQAPWNVVNSDGFDLHGLNILVKDVTVANGDQDVVLNSTRERASRYITVEGARLYSRAGVALLGDGIAIRDVLVKDLAMTGQVASFRVKPDPDLGERIFINGRDPNEMPLRRNTTGEALGSWGKALPVATGEIQAMLINFNMDPKKPLATKFLNIDFQQVCLQDVVRPIQIIPRTAYSTSKPPPAKTLPVVQNIVFKDVHVLAPSEQFPRLDKNKNVVPGRGFYEFDATALADEGFVNRFTLNNVVFADQSVGGGTSLRQITAQGNAIRTVANVYPAVLNELDYRSLPKGIRGAIGDNAYPDRTRTHDPRRAYRCPASLFPFLTGELFLSAEGAGSNHQKIEVPAGSPVTLNAVVQPAMSQTTWFSPYPTGYGTKPGLLAVGSPTLRRPVEFYRGKKLVGSGTLGANGTLASMTITRAARGTHVYTAMYPGDAYYRPFAFGSVKVTGR